MSHFNNLPIFKNCINLHYNYVIETKKIKILRFQSDEENECLQESKNENNLCNI